MGKYRLRLKTTFHTMLDDIGALVELEEIEEETTTQTKDGVLWNDKPKETLEEFKICELDDETLRQTAIIMANTAVRKVLELEERLKGMIPRATYDDSLMACTIAARLGMIPKARVLEVFDGNIVKFVFEGNVTCGDLGRIRKSLEAIGRRDDEKMRPYVN